jgi:phage baseplate assembly protein V
MFFRDQPPKNPKYKAISTIAVVAGRKNDPVRGPMVRVTWNDSRKTSTWLPVAQQGTVGMSWFRCPRIGERVKVTRLVGGPELGIVEGSVYDSYVKSPVQDNLDNLHVTFDDGTSITFDPSNSTLTLDSKGPINLKTKGPIKLESEGDVEVDTQANLNAKASGKATVEAPDIELKGNVKVTGNLTVEDALTAEGVQFNSDIKVTGNGTASGLWIDSTGAGVGS